MRATIVFMFLFAFAPCAFAPAFAQQQYGIGIRPAPPPEIPIDCRYIGKIELSEPESKIRPALTWGHVGRFAAVTAPCIRLDYWVVTAGQLQITLHTQTGEALEANINVGPSAVYATGQLFDTFGVQRGLILIRSLDGGCSRLYVNAYADGARVIPVPGPADLELFVRYVSVPNNPCVP